MTDPRPEKFDHELSHKGILGFLAGLTLVVLFCCALVWGISIWLRDDLSGQDTFPSPLAEAQVIQTPPSPTLQTHPEIDLVGFREQQDAWLHSYDWVDRAAGKVRIPIAEAMARVAHDGVPSWTAEEQP